jgi:hypothetical protein
LQILENSGRYWDTSIYQYLYQYCIYWKILVIGKICTSIVIPVSRPDASYYPKILIFRITNCFLLLTAQLMTAGDLNANSIMGRKIDFPEFLRNGTGCYCLFCVSCKH